MKDPECTEHHAQTQSPQVASTSISINSKLPPELLIEIFSRVEPDVILVDSRRRYTVPMVCKLWRSLLLRTPEFWANALSQVLLCLYDSDDEPQKLDAQVKAHLELSREQPLNLKLLCLPYPVFQMFAAHAHRIASVEVSVKAVNQVA